jgi:YD repeat-containing protein
LTISSQGSGLGLPHFLTFVDHGDGTGQFTFAPGLQDGGRYTITVTATDNGDGNGRYAILSVSQSFVLTVNTPNLPPHLAPVGDKVAVFGQQLQLTLRATDGDQDPLTFSALGLPARATLTPSSTYGQAVVTWTPTASDAGTYTVVFQVTDNGNNGAGPVGSDQQTVHIVVRASNSAPILLPVGDQTVAEGQTLTVPLHATDPDGDPVTYSITNLPPGATLDPISGVFSWTPTLFEAGKYSGVILSASDGNLSASTTITITVTPVNQAPQLVPLYPQSGREGTPLQFAVVADDPDGDAVTYSVVSGLPRGATFDSASGKFQWTPDYDQEGDYTVRFAAADPGGLSDQIDVQIHIDNVDRPPTLGVTSHAAVIGQPLSFQLVGADPDQLTDPGTTLTYSATGLPEGAVLDPQTGQFTWTPGPAQVGDYPVTFAVSDGQLITTQSVLLRATINPVPPAVFIELTPSFPAVPGQSVIVHASASSVAPITGITVQVNGQPLTLDSHGRGTYVPAAPGRIAVSATATDGDGLVGHYGTVLKVRDPNDKAAPAVALDPRLSSRSLTAPTGITGTVSDTNLDYWVLEQAPLGSSAFTTLAQGNTPVFSAALASLDPTALENGFYQLRLTAADISGRVSQTVAVVEVDTAAKSTQYLRTETDITVQLGGATVSLTRQYDSLAQGQSGTFGFGWRLVNRDVNVQTNVPATGHESQGIYNPFRVGTRLYLTLPDGSRVGFTFAPVTHQQAGVTWYTPAFQADPGVSWTLASAGGVLTKAGDRFYDLKTAVPYNPASGEFTGPDYTLTGPDGTVYDISTARGVIDETLPGGPRLYLSDSGITASNGDTLTFVKGAQGRLSTVIAPDGTRVIYGYDAAGNLVSARNLTLGQSSRYGYAQDQQHLLNLVVSPEAGASAVVQYTPGPVVVPLTADLGSSGQFLTSTRAGSLTAGGTDLYSFTFRPSEVHSTTSGTVYLGVQVQATSGSSFQPAVPVIPGLTPVASGTGANGAFALFTVTREGLELLKVSGANGTTGGAYSLRLFVAGDVNADGVVDGVDGQLLAAALGTSVGQAGYVIGADANLDGTINATDLQLLAADLGYQANHAPIVTAGQLLTHQDLAVTVDLATLATDPEDDPIYYRVVSAQNGTATLNADAHSVTFTPAAGYTGPASFQFQADDGYGTSPVGSVAVTVSSAPLVGLDFQNRNLTLDPGAATAMIVLGDFADQAGVVLPASYVTFTSTNPAAVAVAPTGQVFAVANGTSVILASSHGIQAATALSVGFPTDTTQQFLAALGLTYYPHAVTLAAEIGQRQLKVSLDNQVDLAAGSTGTVYYVSNPSVIQVSADGLIQAKDPGSATVTVVNGPAEAVIRVNVAAPHTGGSADLGASGGVVQGTDGSIVAIPPGVLSSTTTVSIAPVSVSSLPMQTPGAVTALGAFHLDVGPNPLSVPVQLAIPVDPSIPAGTRVVFYRAATLTDENGNPLPLWMEDEFGTVGTDGYARATSPPAPGVTITGTYFLGEPGPGTGVVNGHISVAAGITAGAGTFAMVASLGGGAGVGAAFSLLAGFVMDLLVGTNHLKMLAIPKVGPVKAADVTLQVTSTSDSEFDLSLPDALANDTLPPSLDDAEVQLDPNKPPLLKLTGTDLGSPGETLSVIFQIGGQDQYDDKGNLIKQVGGKDTIVKSGITLTTSATGGPEVDLVVPKSVTLGVAQIFLTRTFLDSNDQPVTLTSNGVTVANTNFYSAVAQQGGGAVSFFDARDEVPDPDHPGQSKANPNFGGHVADVRPVFAPRYVANTSDNSRTYATLAAGDVAVIDDITFQTINTGNILDLIYLPQGAVPFDITIDPDDRYAYVSDNLHGDVYVISIDPNSDKYNQCVKTIPVPLPPPPPGQPPSGLRHLALSSDGKFLYAAAPNDATYSKPEYRALSRIVVIDTDPKSKTYWQYLTAVDVGQSAYGVASTRDPNVMVVTNYLSDDNGFMVLRRGPDGSYTTSSVQMQLGGDSDSFDVNNVRSVVVTPDAKYAFVAGWDFPDAEVASHNHFEPQNNPAGSNIGIIADPLGSPRLVGATRSIPVGFPLDLAVSGDGKYLYATYPGVSVKGAQSGGALFIYSIDAIDKAVNNPKVAPLLTRFGIDDIDKDGRHKDLLGNLLHNSDIDVRAAYALDLGVTGFFPEFNVYPTYDKNGLPTNQAPIGVGGSTRGVAVQDSFLRLIKPIGSSAAQPAGSPDALTPTFEYKYLGGTVKEAHLYVSALGPGDGLFPGDVTDPNTGGDGNPNRIVNALYLRDGGPPAVDGPNYLHNLITEVSPGTFDFQLPTDRRLTAGQTYYWGVEVITEDGHRERKATSFKAPAVDLHQPFNTVTIITHGFQLSLNPGAKVGEDTWMVKLGHLIADAGGGGVVEIYNKETGEWDGPAPIAGKPLVLVPDWYAESDISDSGFAEAAADAFFAALVRLDQEQGGKVFASPLHFIGHSRGAVVNSEIIQRLGTYFPQVTNIQMTTLDPHDFDQKTLNVNLGLVLKAANLIPYLRGIPGEMLDVIKKMGIKIDPIPYGDFQDPDVQVWQNVAFADNYYQTQGGNGLLNQLGLPTFTPNGRALDGADVNVQLDGRAGFTQDDFRLPGLAFGIGGPHSRVWQWYAATAGLDLTNFPTDGDRLFRDVADSTPQGPAAAVIGLARLLGIPSVSLLANGLYRPFEDYNPAQPNPWFTALEKAQNHPFTLGAKDAPWEGTGEGWYFSDLGGGQADRPPSLPARTPVTFDNQDPTSPPSPVAVPTVFNGNFAWGNMHRDFADLTGFYRSNRFPFSYEVPGWSFQGGSGFSFADLVDVTSALVLPTDPATVVTSVYTTIWKQVFDTVGKNVIKVIADKAAGLAGGAIDKWYANLSPDRQLTWLNQFNGMLQRLDGLLQQFGFSYDKLADAVSSQGLDAATNLAVKAIEGKVGDAFNDLFNKSGDTALLMGGQRLFQTLFAQAPVPELTKDAASLALQSAFNLNRVTHNRLYIPPDAQYVQFDIAAPLLIYPDARIRVSMNVPGQTNGDQVIGEVELQPSFFDKFTYSVPIPDEFRGKVGTVTFETVNEEADAAGSDLTDVVSQFFFLDNVTLADSPSPQVAAAPAGPGAPAPSGAALTDDALRPIVEEAIARWGAAGATAGQLTALRQATVQVGAVPSGDLGIAVGHVVTISRDAAGTGWFVDPTPSDDLEFSQVAAPSEFHAGADSPAFGKTDLLTVVSHELGHVLGLPEFDAASHPGDVMDASITPGVRRTPQAGDVQFLQPATPEAAPATPTAATPVAAAATPATAPSAPASFGGAVATVFQSWGAPTVAGEADPAGPPLQPPVFGQPLLLGRAVPTHPLLNGQFNQGANDLADWSTSDPQYVVVNSANQAIISESRSDIEADLYQDFIFPQGARSLSFTLDGFTFDNSLPSGATPDAFGVSLLDPTTQNPLVTTVDGQTDSFFIQDVVPGALGTAASGVTVTAGTAPGSLRITLDVSSLHGQGVRLVFRFIGGSDASQLKGSAAVSDVSVAGSQPPTATFSGDTSVNEGSTATVGFSNQVNSQGVPTTSGFTYSYDFNNSGTFQISNSTSASATVPESYLDDGPGSLTVHGRITDPSGLFTDYTTTISILNVNPTAALANNGPVTEGGTATVSFTNPSDPSQADTHAGFHYAFSQDQSALASATYANSGPGSSQGFTFGVAGNYTVYGRVIDKDGGFTQYSTTVLVQSAFQPIAISGAVYKDIDQSGSRGVGEPTLSGWTVQLFLNGATSALTTATTDTSGTYSFPNLGPGVYRVREVAQPGWQQTSADPADITAASGVNVSGVNFGDHQLAAPAVVPAGTRDNSQLLYSDSGGWATVTGAGWNNNYRLVTDSGTGTGSKTARWTVRLTPGLYEVYATYPAAAGNAPNAPYTILNSSTTLATIVRDQTRAAADATYGGVAWTSLGVFNLNGSGTVNLTVSLSDQGTTGRLIADGVMAVAFSGGSPQVAAGTGPGAPALAPDQLASVVAQAEDLWLALGLTPEQQAALYGTQVTLGGLPGGIVGTTSGEYVTIDPTAAGNGWFVGPAGSGAFRPDGAQWSAGPGSPAFGRMDLLTVVTHELGHVIGREDIDNAAHPGDVMDVTLPTGTRRLPGGPPAAPAQAAAAMLSAPGLVAGVGPVTAGRGRATAGLDAFYAILPALGGPEELSAFLRPATGFGALSTAAPAPAQPLPGAGPLGTARPDWWVGTFDGTAEVNRASARTASPALTEVPAEGGNDGLLGGNDALLVGADGDLRLVFDSAGHGPGEMNGGQGGSQARG